jgi:hypothetical protein
MHEGRQGRGKSMVECGSDNPEWDKHMQLMQIP